MNKELTNQNIDQIIESSKQGEGVLSTHLGAAYEAFRKEETGRNTLRKDKLDEAALDAKAKQRLDEYAKQIKTTLQKVSAGEPLSTSQEADLQQMAGIMGTVGQASSALGGGIFGILSFIPSLMSTFGDYIGAAYAYFFPDKKNPDAPKSFGEALADIKAKKGIKEFADKLGVDDEELAKAINKKPESTKEEQVASNPDGAKAAADSQPKPKTVTMHPHYTAPNGSFVSPPSGGPTSPKNGQQLA